MSRNLFLISLLEETNSINALITFFVVLSYMKFLNQLKQLPNWAPMIRICSHRRATCVFAKISKTKIHSKLIPLYFDNSLDVSMKYSICRKSCCHFKSSSYHSKFLESLQLIIISLLLGDRDRRHVPTTLFPLYAWRSRTARLRTI